MRYDTAEVDGEAIRRIRIQKGWSQVELARRVSCDRRRVQELEKGGRAKLETISDFAEALGVENEALIKNVLPVKSEEYTPLSIKMEELADPVLARYFAEAFHKAAKEYQRAKSVHNTAPGVGYVSREELIEMWGDDRFMVYFFPGTNKYGDKTYVYAIGPMSLHSEVLEALELGQIHEKVFIIAMGLHSPSDDVRNTIYEYYGFRH